MDDMENLWSDFLLGRLTEHKEHKINGALKDVSARVYLGMTDDEYDQWLLNDIVSDRVKRVWRKSFDAWLARGMRN